MIETVAADAAEKWRSDDESTAAVRKAYTSVASVLKLCFDEKSGVKADY